MRRSVFFVRKIQTKQRKCQKNLQYPKAVLNRDKGKKLSIVICFSEWYNVIRKQRRIRKMYYGSGNYEAFARPEKPEGVDHRFQNTFPL